MNSERVEFANTLRGLAALSVVVSHYLGVFWYSPAAVSDLTGIPTIQAVAPDIVKWIQIPNFNWGAYGVALFFIISGFVIPFSFRTYGRADFLTGRFFRIYPTYLIGFTITLCAIAFGCWVSGRQFPHSGYEVFFGYALGTRDLAWSKSIDGIVWTLEVELKFYILCALLAPLLRSLSIKTFIAPFGLLLVIAFLGRHANQYTYAFALSFPQMIFMFCGVVFHFYYRGVLGRYETAALLICLYAGFAIAQKVGFFDNSALLVSYGIALVTFATAFRFPALVNNIPTVSFWSDISYPLYVVHGVAGYVSITLLIVWGLSPLVSIILTFAAATLIATVIHFAVEVPSHEMGRKIPQMFKAAARPAE